MKKISKIFAIIALLWAIFSPPLLSVLTATNGVGPWKRLAHTSATDLRSALPKEPLTATTVVNLPAQGVSSSAAALDWGVDAINNILTLQKFYTIISSVFIIILAICVWSTGKKNAKKTI